MTTAAPDAWRSALVEVIQKTGGPDAAALAAWVLDGTGDAQALLTALNARTRSAFTSNILVSTETLPALRILLDEIEGQDPELLGRFVALATGASHQGGSGFNPALRAFPSLVQYVYDPRVELKEIPFDVSFLERLCRAYGRSTSELLTSAHDAFARSYSRPEETLVTRLRGYPAYVRLHQDTIRELAARAGVADRLAALELVVALPDEVLVLFVSELATLATSGSVKVRDAARPLLARCGERRTEELRLLAEAGKPDTRLWALRLLWESGDAEQRAWCEERADADRAGPVRMLVQEWASLAVGTAAEEIVPEPPAFDWQERIAPEDVARLREHLEEANRYGDKFEPDLVDRVAEALVAGSPDQIPRGRGPNGHSLHHHWSRSEVAPRLGLAARTALLHAAGDLVNDHSGLTWSAVGELEPRYEATGHPTLSEIAAMLDDLGYSGGKAVLFTWGNGSEWGTSLSERPDEEVAEFAQLQLDAVLDQVAPAQREYGIHKLAAYRALAPLPVLPARAVDKLFSVAFGTAKPERRPAQDLLDRVPAVVQRVVPVLTDSRAELRAEAAAWLARLADPVAREPLEKAFAKEKHDLPLGAMLDALQALGQPVEKYLRPADLVAQASKAVAKGLPKDLAWFPWDRMPRVRWVSGEVVPVEVLQWFLAQAVKAKSPEPNALLRTYTSLFDPGDRQELGQLVLEAWVEEDAGKVELNWSGRMLPVGSAAASKGVLAVAAACAGERAAPVTQRYLRRWHGQRSTQGKALVGMLGWIEHPSATQLLLAVGSRFRSKSIEAEAAKQTEALAARKGWTLAELADRSVPVAGLDDDGTLELSYGDRVFTARLLPDLEIEVLDPDGKTIKALPAARAADDDEAVREAKKALSATKKELKAVVQLQTERLHEAMCTQRTWNAEVWERYVLGHPVMRHLAARLVWSVTGATGTVLVRPLGDGTLTDADDRPVELTADTEVALAHESLADPEVARAWSAHLADYEVLPLFLQFGRGALVVAEDQLDGTEINDFEGTLLGSFTLRSRATALGYTRGEVGDAAIFSTYDKRYPALGLVAHIGFTGAMVSEEIEQKVALTTLVVERLQRGRSRAVALREVPPVLLAETWNDMRTIAAHGEQDPDWQKKVEW